MVERSGGSLDAAYGALAHPVRRDMLERLRGGQARVTDLAIGYDVSLAASSKHVRVLERAGLVRREVVGREHRLSLEVAPLRVASDWLGHYRAFWDARLDALDAHLRGRSPR